MASDSLVKKGDKVGCLAGIEKVAEGTGVKQIGNAYWGEPSLLELEIILNQKGVCVCVSARVCRNLLFSSGSLCQRGVKQQSCSAHYHTKNSGIRNADCTKAGPEKVIWPTET